MIEQRSPSDVAALAHHYDAAGTVETAAKAVRYAGLAAEQAERRFAHREAATLWQQAIAAFDRAHTGRAHAGGGSVRDRLELQLRMIRALALCGDMTAARAHRGEAMSVALPLGDLELTARVAAALAVPHKGIARDFTRTAWEIVDVTEKALVELPEGEQSLRASLLATLALELEGSATERGYQASLEAEELARSSGDPALLAMALSGRLRQSYTLTQVDERETIGRELLRVGAESGQIAVQTLAHLVLLECAAARGDFAEADEHLAQAERLGRQYALPAPAAVGAWYAGQRLMITGDYAGAERAYRNAARLTARAGMLEGRQDLPLIATFCLHLVDGRAAEMAEPLGEATSAARSGRRTPTPWRSPRPGTSGTRGWSPRAGNRSAPTSSTSSPSSGGRSPGCCWTTRAGCGRRTRSWRRSATASPGPAPGWSPCGRWRRRSATSPYGSGCRPATTTTRRWPWPSGWACPAGSPRPARRSRAGEQEAKGRELSPEAKRRQSSRRPLSQREPVASRLLRCTKGGLITG
ncbi:hypothetical protein [Microbispora sp. GKU 823]|uniref:hypothetical protein n=1 Tax=Microbispora sp. GKU 823 TaxID=1652100 RepID=UPI002118CDCF|nr:hypothetical protein [Microbispora sp. GKU 823]